MTEPTQNEWSNFLVAALMDMRDEAKSFLDTYSLDIPLVREKLQVALCVASRAGRLDMMVLLIERGADPSAADANTETPLMAAVWNGKGDAVDYLLGLGVDTGIKNKDGLTASAWAVKRGHQHLAVLIDEYALSRADKVEPEDSPQHITRIFTTQAQLRLKKPKSPFRTKKGPQI